MAKKIKFHFVPITCVLFTAFIFISPLIFYHSMILGVDSVFHLNRFYDFASQLQSNNFNYFQANYGYAASARIINPLYSPFINFLVGSLLAITKSWIFTTNTFSFIVFATAGISMYFLLMYVGARRFWAFTGAFLYMTSPVITYWTIENNFTGVGSAILPIAILQAVRMIKNPDKPIKVFSLALTVALMIEIHLFTALLGCTVLLIFFLASIMHSQQKLEMIVKVIQSAVLAVLLSSNVIFSYFELSTSNHLLGTFPNQNMQGSAMFFSFNGADWNHYGLIYSEIIIIVTLYLFTKWTEISFLDKVLGISGLFYLFISSTYFPWNKISSYFPKVRSLIQFPQRFSAVVFILFLLLMVRFIVLYSGVKTRKYSTIVLTIAVLAVAIKTPLSAIHAKAQQWQSNEIKLFYTGERTTNNPQKIRGGFMDRNNLGEGLNFLPKRTPDYLPVKEALTVDKYIKMDPYSVYKNEVLENKMNYSRIITKDGTMHIRWVNRSGKSRKVQLPLIVYSRSEVNLNSKEIRKSQFDTTRIGAIVVKEKPGINSLTINYKPTFVVSMSIFISPLLWLLSLFYVFLHINFFKKLSFRKK